MEITREMERRHIEELLAELMLTCGFGTLLLEKDITEVTQLKLSERYSFVSYSGIDRDTWIDIEISAKEFFCYEQGSEAWNRYFAARLDELPNRMFFIENDRFDHMYSVGGRIKFGETAEEAAVREVFEETGVKMEIGRLVR